MNEQLVIVTISLLIGFAIGWPIGYWRCLKRCKRISDMILGMTRKDGRSMNLRLVERRTDTKVVSCVPENEGSCMECSTKNAIAPTEALRENIHDLRDVRGNVMMENRVSCGECGAKWVDVFCRVYPVVVDLPDEQEG